MPIRVRHHSRIPQVDSPPTSHSFSTLPSLSLLRFSPILFAFYQISSSPPSFPPPLSHHPSLSNALDLPLGIRPIQGGPVVSARGGPFLLVLLGRLALCAPRVDARNLLLERGVDQAVPLARVLADKVGRDDEGGEGGAATALWFECVSYFALLDMNMCVCVQRVGCRWVGKVW